MKTKKQQKEVSAPRRGLRSHSTLASENARASSILRSYSSEMEVKLREYHDVIRTFVERIERGDLRMTLDHIMWALDVGRLARH